MSADWHGREPDPVADEYERELSEAVYQLDAYRQAVALLRPYMEGTTRTVAEALELMAADGLDVSRIGPLLVGEAQA